MVKTWRSPEEKKDNVLLSLEKQGFHHLTQEGLHQWKNKK